MVPLKAFQIVGNWATLLLPIDKNDNINFTALEAEIDTLIAMNVNGIYSNGTAGEFYNQSEAEFAQINSMLAEKCNAANMPFQIGCSNTNPVMALAHIKKVLPLQPSAIQIILPDWFPPTMTEIIRYLRGIADAAGPIGLVLYNPPHAKKRLTPEEFARICDAGIALVGCKVPGGDTAWYTTMKRLNPQLSLFVPGHTLASGLQQGAHGAYSNVACLHPGAAQRWYELMLNDMNKALELEKRIQQFMTTYIVPFIRDLGYANQAADKFLAALGGWSDVGCRLRWPYQSVPETEVDRVRPAVREMLPEFFGNAHISL